MLIWVDMANSPHVAVFEPIVEHLRARGEELVLTARDHAQTVTLARRAWSDVEVVGCASPPGLAGKARSLAARTVALRHFAARTQPDVALSHGSYAQVLAAVSLRLPAVTMMDYEHQPANHLSFRLARRVLVPEAFPEAALRRFGAASKTIRYPGFKEDLYLARGSAGEMPASDEVLAVFRPPPEGALYHRDARSRFDAILDAALGDARVRAIVLPRDADQAARYRARGAEVPGDVPPGRALLAAADLFVGGGGTMTREAALLGTPTYTAFAAELGAVDRALIARGLVADLRTGSTLPSFVKKEGTVPAAHPADPGAILAAVERALRSAVA